MANPEHVAKLQEGVAAWNNWRKERGDEPVDLSRLHLSKMNFDGADFAFTNFYGSILIECSFRDVDLHAADFTLALAPKADFRGADFFGANLSRVKLWEADLTDSVFGATTVADVDLRNVIGLESVRHKVGSTIGVDTIYASRGEIPVSFLERCGLPKVFIDYIPSLVGSMNPIQWYSVFISYSSQDQAFAERLYADLQSKNVRCRFAPEDLRIGDKFRMRIDEKIRLYDKLLLVLSEHSVGSDWVEKEVETAMEKERQQERTMLFPIRLDEAVMKVPTGWPADVRRTRHIGDFKGWKEYDAYQKAFDRLIRDLQMNDAEKK